MKHVEKVAPVTAALASLAATVCCLPWWVGFTTVTAGLGVAVAAYQPWFLVASVVLLSVGAFQLRRVQRTCARRPYASLAVFGLSAVIVCCVDLFPDVVAGLLADWLP